MSGDRDAIGRALVIVRRALRERGFSAKGATFHRKAAGGNTLLVSVQRSVKSSASDSQLTVNYGVYSTRIGEKLDDDPRSTLDIANAHWRKRTMHRGQEQWVHVRATDAPDEAARVILDAVESVLDDLVSHGGDEALRDEWLSGSSPGIGAIQRLTFLAVLLHELGPGDRLGEVIRDLRARVAGTAHEQRVGRQLAQAGIAGAS